MVIVVMKVMGKRLGALFQGIVNSTLHVYTSTHAVQPPSSAGPPCAPSCTASLGLSHLVACWGSTPVN